MQKVTFQSNNEDLSKVLVSNGYRPFRVLLFRPDGRTIAEWYQAGEDYLKLPGNMTGPIVGPFTVEISFY